MQVSPTRAEAVDDVAIQRRALWPDHDLTAHRLELADMIADRSGRLLHLSALDDDGSLIGFAEAALRHDHVNGCQTSPVVFLEGLYVDPQHRRRGAARALAAAVEAWARSKGCTEFASDALLANRASHRMHAALGFEETERGVYFRKAI